MTPSRRPKRRRGVTLRLVDKRTKSVLGTLMIGGVTPADIHSPEMRRITRAIRTATHRRTKH